MQFDDINKVKHYNLHPSGVECIVLIQDLSFCFGNAIKYVWRAGLKSDNKEQDLNKSIYYLEKEQSRLEALGLANSPLNIDMIKLDGLCSHDDLIGEFCKLIRASIVGYKGNLSYFSVFNVKPQNIMLKILTDFLKCNKLMKQAKYE